MARHSRPTWVSTNRTRLRRALAVTSRQGGLVTAKVRGIAMRNGIGLLFLLLWTGAFENERANGKSLLSDRKVL